MAPLPAAPTGITKNDAEHYASSLEQMQIIKTMFQCDLTPVASFTFGYGNSSIAFSTRCPVSTADRPQCFRARAGAGSR